MDMDEIGLEALDLGKDFLSRFTRINGSDRRRQFSPRSADAIVGDFEQLDWVTVLGEKLVFGLDDPFFSTDDLVAIVELENFHGLSRISSSLSLWERAGVRGVARIYI
jgi:hypothetical protein